MKLNHLVIQTFSSVPFYNIYLKSFSIYFIFFDEITIPSTFLGFVSDTCFGFAIFPEILFSINSLVTSAVLWTTFWEAVFAASGSAIEALSKTFSPYFWTEFSQKIKINIL